MLCRAVKSPNLTTMSFKRIIEASPSLSKLVLLSERSIGIVFQSYALFPTMTVYDNIAFGLKLKKLKKPEVDRRVREIARKVDLSDEAR